jgi:phosphoserine aminotransferase
MARVHNFNAGPAGLPLPALERAQRELLDFEGTGMSIMEHSHRGKAYEGVHNEAIQLVRDLLSVPASYEVLFLQGGASQQFATIPMNLLHPGKSADYVLTGGWSEKAYEEAGRVGKVRVAATTEVEKKYTRIPRQDELNLDAEAAYVHITTNNTLFGTQWHHVPEVGNVPLVADMSSDFMWKPFDVSRYAMIYAGAQKNIGPSGVVVVLMKKELVEARPQGHPHHLPLRDPRREQLALQHRADLLDLPDPQRARVHEGDRRPARDRAPQPRQGRRCSTRPSTRTPTSSAPPWRSRAARP